MADVQVEHGHTRIADALLEALSRAPLPGSHMRVMLAVLRLTYGYQQRERQMGSKLISSVCGIDDRRVRRLLAELEQWGLIRRIDAAPGRRSTVAVVKDFEQWNVQPTGREGQITRANVSPGTREPGRVHVSPGLREPDNPGTREPGYPGTREPAAKENSTENSREKSGGDAADPAGHSAPVGDHRLLNLLSKLNGEPDEKSAWLDHELPVIEAEVADGNGTLRAMTVRYYRQYLKGDREYRDWDRKQRLRQRKLAWQAEHEGKMAKIEAEEGHATAHR